MSAGPSWPKHIACPLRWEPKCREPRRTSGADGSIGTRRRQRRNRGDGRSIISLRCSFKTVASLSGRGRGAKRARQHGRPIPLRLRSTYQRRRRRSSDDQVKSKQNAASQFTLCDISVTRVIPPQPHFALTDVLHSGCPSGHHSPSGDARFD